MSTTQEILEWLLKLKHTVTSSTLSLYEHGALLQTEVLMQARAP
jgi:hypothetical protein